VGVDNAGNQVKRDKGGDWRRPDQR